MHMFQRCHSSRVGSLTYLCGYVKSEARAKYLYRGLVKCIRAHIRYRAANNNHRVREVERVHYRGKVNKNKKDDMTIN
jgi:hypothetical protein